jgi:restriction system protein
MYEAIVADMGLTEAQLAILHDPERGNVTEAGCRMAWARMYLKKAGYLTNSERGVWALTKKGLEGTIDSGEVVRNVRAGYVARDEPEAPPSVVPPAGSVVPPPIVASLEAELESSGELELWRQSAMKCLMAMQPAAFERLCQRILRESGFVEVKVTGQSGDGGIDGIGILRMQRVVSFQVLFQCKRWQGAVGAKDIRDFRGAMVGRSDKGLFITTGSFTRAAQQEATRDGAPPVDLIDGAQLLDLLKELKLGLRTRVVETVEVDEGWFQSV